MRVLVLRFSAMGDVAMTVPVIQQVLKAHPDLEITLVSQSRFFPFFQGIPRLEFYGEDIKSIKGIQALYSLFKQLYNKGPFNSIIDLHGSLRTRILSFFFSTKGISVHRIDKGKKEKKKALRKRDKVLYPLKSTMNRYLEVFLRARLNLNSLPIPDEAEINFSMNWLGIQVQSSWKKKEEFLKSLPGIMPNSKPILIGWAPLAGFKLKEMPIGFQVNLVNQLLRTLPQAFLFLIASPHEKESLSSFWETGETQSRIFFSGDWTSDLEDELALIRELNIMVSMNSGNMHLAALLGIRVLGLFGTTHPDLGFFPYLQRQSGTYGLEYLSCRPCTVFGNGTCYRGDFACMNQIDPLILQQRILDRLA